MNTRKIVAAAFGLSIALGSAPAVAKTLDSYATGAHGWSYGSNRSVAIKDTIGDGDEVYVDYQRSGEAVRRLTNYSGVGTTSYSVNRTPAVVAIRACTERDLAVPDSCDSWRR